MLKIEKIEILKTEIMNLSFNEARTMMEEFLKGNSCKRIFTPNTEIVMALEKNAELREEINGADMVVPDGIGLVMAGKIKGAPLKERVTGFDLSMELLKIAERDSLSVYLLGAKEGVSYDASENLRKKFPNIKIAGFHHGYFKGAHTGFENSDEEMAIIDEINVAKPDIIFVGLGFPYQELWINKSYRKLDAKVIIGNGGVIDILAGKASRAPDIFIKLNLEWFYRLLKDPKRIKRQLVIPVFILKILFGKDSVKKRSE